MNEFKARWLRWMRGLLVNWFGVADDCKEILRAAKLAANLIAGMAIRAVLILLLPLSALVLAYLDLCDERKRAAKGLRT